MWSKLNDEAHILQAINISGAGLLSNGLEEIR